MKNTFQGVVAQKSKEASIFIYQLLCLVFWGLLLEHELFGLFKLPQTLDKAHSQPKEVLKQRDLELSARNLQHGLSGQ